MLWRNLLPLLSFLVFNCDGSETPTQIFSRLMKNYSRHEAPGFPDKPTEVKLGVYLLDLKYFGDETSDFFISFDLKREWNDPRLSFSTADGTRKTIRLPEDSWKEIWIPDTFLKGVRNVKVADDVSSNSYVTVTSDGDVFYIMIVSAIVSAQSGVRKYPFGEQRIEIVFESFGDTTEVLYYTAGKHKASDRIHQQFSISDFQLDDCTQNFTDGTFTCLKIALAIDRGGSNFILRIYLPSTLIVILSWLAFWIDLDKSSQSRLLIGIPSLVALILLDAFAGTSKVATNSTTSLNCWMTACYIFVFGALVEFAVVNVLSRKRGSARGFDFLKPPFAAVEKAVEANGKEEVDAGDGGGNRKARLVDWFSRILFPTAFLLFNLIYWIMVLA